MKNPAVQARTGVLYGLAAYLAWGVFPIYFKWVASVLPLEVLAHRIVWSLVLLALLILRAGRLREVLASLRSPRDGLLLAGTTILIALNWFTFIWAVTNSQVMQASLGYYINPLVSVFLGVVFLRERLSRWGIVAALLALSGVAYQVVQFGRVPVVALILAVSFGFYGLLRKISRAGGVIGLTVETGLLFPFALAYLVYLGGWKQGTAVSGSLGMMGLLVLAGPITTLPLLWFAQAARRLNLATVGFLQYIAPTMQFLVALGYGEVFTRHHALTFGCVWTGLLIFSIDKVRIARSGINKG